MKIAHVARSDLNRVARLGRAVSFAFYVLCSLMVYFIGRKVEFSAWESALAATMLLAQPAFLAWNATFRVDLTTLFAMLLSLYFAVGNELPSSWDSISSGFFAGLALLLKASAVSVVFSVLGFWLIRKKHPQITLFILSASVPVVVTLGILIWHKEPFTAQFISGGKSIWSVASGAKWMFSRRSEAMLWAPLAIGLFGCRGAFGESERSRTVLSFFLCSLLVGLATISQVAGDVNYFQPAVAGAALLLPFAIRQFRQAQKSAGFQGILAVAVLFAAISGLAIELYMQRYPPATTNERLEELGQYRVLSDWPLFSVHGRDPDFLDPQSMHLMELTGNWDSSGFVRRIQNGDYDIILSLGGSVVRSYRGISFFGKSEIAAMNSSYKILCVNGPRLVLQPRFREITATPRTLTSILGAPCLPDKNNSDPKLSMAPSAR